MEYYEAKKLKEDLEESIERVGVKVGNASNSFEGNVDRIIESNERLALEQQINRATEQLISIRIAYKSGVISVKEAQEMLKFSYVNLINCCNKTSKEMRIKYKYGDTIKSVTEKYVSFAESLSDEKSLKTAEDFKF